MKMPPYSLQHIWDSYRWLGHRSYTELNAYHPEYRPGRENAKRNEDGNFFPKISYAHNEAGVVQFVKKHYADHMVCYGLNPRPRVFRNPHGEPRSAYESDIHVAKNLVFDFDALNDLPSEAQLEALNVFLRRADDYFLDLRLRPPVKAFTGRGYHLLFAFAPIQIRNCPDLSARMKAFRDGFGDSYRHELANIEVKLDSIQDLRRMVRVYGTAKPTIRIVSRFYGKERIEDAGLRAYLLEMVPSEPLQQRQGLALKVGNELPDWLPELLKNDSRVGSFWSGTGKPEGTDTSRSGYDYSLVLRLLHLGYKDLDELATVLALRPEGSVQKSGKNAAYVTRTIGSALLHLSPRQRDSESEDFYMPQPANSECRDGIQNGSSN